MRFILTLLFLIPQLLIAQCAGVESFTLNPLPVNNTYAPGTTVTMCFTMDGWNGTTSGSNWFEGFALNLGSGWVSYNPIQSPGDCSADGEWLWLESVTSDATGLIDGPGYFYEGPTGPVDGNSGNDWGDFGTTCVWTFCVELQVSSDCDPQSLFIGVTTYADGTMGSWGNNSCNDPEFVVFDGLVAGGDVNTSNIDFSLDTICVGLNQNYSVDLTTGSTYDWSITGGGSLNNNGQNFTSVTWQTPGDYTVSVQETTSNGCIGQPVVLDVTVADYQISFDSSYFLCPSESVYLSALPSGGFWNGTNLLNNLFQATEPGIFYATYELNKWGCLRKDSIDIRVRDNFEGFPISYLDKTIDMCEDFSEQIYQVADSINVTYTWYIDNQLQFDTDNSISFTWQDTTLDHTIEVFGTDDKGCRSDKSYLTIHVDACHRLYVPNSFSPNDDGINDAFYINGINFYDPKLQIYNRWGDLVWQLSSKNVYWTGNDGKGYYCEDGVYNWILTYKDDKGFGHEQVGHVNLIR